MNNSRAPLPDSDSGKATTVSCHLSPIGGNPTREESRGTNDHDPFAFLLPSKRDTTLGKCPADGERNIAAVLEQRRVIAPEAQQPLRQE